MPSRVTQSMLNSQMLRNLNNNMLRMDKLQNQLSTGRRINKPSDDPVGISFSMRYRSELSANDQFTRNLNEANSWLNYADTILGQTGDILQRTRELVIQGANSSNPESSLDSIKSEVEQLYDQLVNSGNSKFNGKYVFNGQMTDLIPYDKATAATQSTDAADIPFEIGAGVKVAVNVTGNKVFGNPGDTDNAFQVLQDIISALGNQDTTALSENVLGRLDSRIDQFLEIRAEIGAKSNRLELAESRLADININVQTLLSKTEDADISEVITNLKTSENVYQASLSVGAKLIRPSLIDFLR
jgi:flagellar hook-associated protein 3 FlgL